MPRIQLINGLYLSMNKYTYGLDFYFCKEYLASYNINPSSPNVF